MKNLRQLTVTALCIALGVVIPLAFHSIPDFGKIMLPMHLPVLLCGLLCGWQYGLACGILAPLLSNLLTQMPPTALLPGMLCELAVYGCLSGLLLLLLRKQEGMNKAVSLYVSLVGAMLCGRLVSGVLNMLIFQAGKYSLAIWLSASFTKALPGIFVQLLLLPAVVFALERVKLLPGEKNHA